MRPPYGMFKSSSLKRTKPNQNNHKVLCKGNSPTHNVPSASYVSVIYISAKKDTLNNTKYIVENNPIKQLIIHVIFHLFMTLLNASRSYVIILTLQTVTEHINPTVEARSQSHGKWMAIIEKNYNSCSHKLL